MDISIVQLKSDIHTWIYPWILSMDISMDIHIHGNPGNNAVVQYVIVEQKAVTGRTVALNNEQHVRESVMTV